MNKQVTFSTAKLLKEKNIIIEPLTLKSKTDYIEGYDWDTEDETDFLKVREFQFEDNVCSHLFLKPTIAEVVMWLYEKHGIWIESRFLQSFKVFYFELININNLKGTTSKGENHFNSPTKAYEAAIEYVLTKLI